MNEFSISYNKYHFKCFSYVSWLRLYVVCSGDTYGFWLARCKWVLGGCSANLYDAARGSNFKKWKTSSLQREMVSHPQIRLKTKPNKNSPSMTEKSESRAVAVGSRSLSHQLRPHPLQVTPPHLHWRGPFSLSSQTPPRQTHAETHMHMHARTQRPLSTLTFNDNTLWKAFPDTKSPAPGNHGREPFFCTANPFVTSCCQSAIPRLELQALISSTTGIVNSCLSCSPRGSPINKPVGWSASLTIAEPPLPNPNKKSVPVDSSF